MTVGQWASIVQCLPSHWQCIRSDDNCGKLGEDIRYWPHNELDLSFLPTNECNVPSENSVKNCDHRIDDTPPIL